jgi:hypothetical protein
VPELQAWQRSVSAEKTDQLRALRHTLQAQRPIRVLLDGHGVGVANEKEHGRPILLP